MSSKRHSSLSHPSFHNDRITRLAYSRDASVYRLVPESVVRPKNINEVKSLLAHGVSTGTPITFRTGGTSLSGQSITNGIIAEVLHDWQNLKILNDGKAIKMQPGVVGAVANKILEPYSRKIGPDPASINAARIGGIVSNNSSGMVCGTQYNSYHTLRDITFLLANGNEYNTLLLNERERFRLSEPDLASGLLNIRKEILNRPDLISKIREKYRIKNTIGYSMNSFIDYEEPLDIFAHLLVGAEGTLAFLENVTLDTIPDYPEKGTGLILFDSPEKAADSVTFFKELGASAIELMDDSSLRTAKHFDSPIYDPELIQDHNTGLLIEYQHDSISEIERMMKESKLYSLKDKSILSMYMVSDEAQRNAIWKVRKGLYPTIGALRESGRSLITEDIAVDTENLAPAIRKLKDIFKRYDLSDGVIFGHAKDGNIHFITSVDLESVTGIQRYENMMNDLCQMTLSDFNGSLKAEHGTGRNMAAFVESEWGGDIYELMWRVKKLADPYNILNPGVLLNRDKGLHLKDIKSMPKVHDEVDTCIECGYCERVCPSKELTLTPRQRIAVMRETKSITLSRHDQKLFDHSIEQTCATDGLCANECPVNINTGTMVKSLRFRGSMDPWYVQFMAKNFRITVSMVRWGINLVSVMDKLSGPSSIRKFTKAINKGLTSKIPVWPRRGFTISRPFKLDNVSDPDFIHFSTCVNRVLSGSEQGISSSEYLDRIGRSAGLKLGSLSSNNTHCCGMSFSSRGYRQTSTQKKESLLKELWGVSSNGAIPIIVDMSPCTQFLMEDNKLYRNLKIIDSVEFIFDIIQKLELKKHEDSLYVHGVCSSQKLGNDHQLLEIVNKCSHSSETAMDPFCCGTGGDRGFRHPDLIKNAVKHSVKGLSSKMGVSSSRTCEMGLSEAMDIKFSSIEALVYNTIKK